MEKKNVILKHVHKLNKHSKTKKINETVVQNSIKVFMSLHVSKEVYYIIKKNFITVNEEKT